MSKFRKFIDIGANLTDLMYSGIYNGTKKHESDIIEVLKRSWESGLDKIIITGGDLDSSEKALELTKFDERLYATVGCHPTRCNEFVNNPSEYLEKLLKTIENGGKKIVAVGECGLDYERLQFCSKEIQQKYFELQLGLIEKFDLPLFLHCRNAADDLHDILKKYTNLRGVVHSFDGTFEEAQKFLELGYYIGLNGCSLKTKENLEMVRALPKEKILIETDCPWCEIRPSHAGYSLISSNHQLKSVKKEKWQPDQLIKSRNEPCNIRQVLDVICGTRQENVDELCEIIYNNTQALFFPN